jgi:hypothetical protein
MAEITYSNGVLTVDGQVANEKSIVALVDRGGTHLFGSEASSKLIGKIRALDWALYVKDHPEDPKGDNYADMTKEQIKSWRTANPDQVSEWAKGIEAEYVKALIGGTIGMRAAGGGTRLDPLEAKIEALAKDFVKVNIMETHDIKPAQYAKDQPVTINGAEYTFSKLVQRRIVRDRDNLEKTARKALAEAARRVEKAREAKKVATSLEDLGL